MNCIPAYGKTLIMVAIFPFHSAATPSVLTICLATWGTSRNLKGVAVTWYKILILSMGATTVLASIPAMPPEIRCLTSFGIMVVVVWVVVVMVVALSGTIIVGGILLVKLRKFQVLQ